MVQEMGGALRLRRQRDRSAGARGCTAFAAGHRNIAESGRGHGKIQGHQGHMKDLQVMKHEEIEGVVIHMDFP